MSRIAVQHQSPRYVHHHLYNRKRICVREEDSCYLESTRQVKILVMLFTREHVYWIYKTSYTSRIMPRGRVSASTRPSWEITLSLTSIFWGSITSSSFLCSINTILKRGSASTTGIKMRARELVTASRFDELCFHLIWE